MTYANRTFATEDLIHIGPEPIEPGRVLSQLVDGDAANGAVATFTGVVRMENSGDPVKELILQHYPGFTERVVAEFVKAARVHWPLGRVVITHRVGAMAPGDVIVQVGISARHRRAALEAVDFLMDVLKSQTPLWKKEVRASGARWIEPRAEDRDDLERWSHILGQTGITNKTKHLT